MAGQLNDGLWPSGRFQSNSTSATWPLSEDPSPLLGSEASLPCFWVEGPKELCVMTGCRPSKDLHNSLYWLKEGLASPLPTLGMEGGLHFWGRSAGEMPFSTCGSSAL